MKVPSDRAKVEWSWPEAGAGGLQNSMEGQVLGAPRRGVDTGFPRWPQSKAEEARLDQGEGAPGRSDGECRAPGTESWSLEVQFSLRMIGSCQGGQR